MATAVFRVGRQFSFIAIPKRIAVKDVTCQSTRTIMSSRTNLEKVMEDLKTNPYFDKYADKISKMQQTSPEEFLERVKVKEEKLRAEKAKSEEERKFQPASKAKPALAGLGDKGMQKKEPKLSDLMKIELVNDKSKDEIIQIWHEYHKLKDCISGAMTTKQFNRIFERAKDYPTFLLPLPRSQGYEFIMCQFHGTEIHMTPLLWYQVHKENAPECLSMTHYIEFAENKDLVLMRGEFDTNSINVQEAQCLVNELQLYYSTDDPQRLNLLETFTKRPDDFKHMDLIANLETISLTPNSNQQAAKSS